MSDDGVKRFRELRNELAQQSSKTLAGRLADELRGTEGSAYKLLERVETERKIPLRLASALAKFLGVSTGVFLDEILAYHPSSDFLQALKLVFEGNRIDALAYLARSVSTNRINNPAVCFLANLLAYRSWMLPCLNLKCNGSVGSAAFSPDGMQIVTASGGKECIVWNAETGVKIRNLFDGVEVLSARFNHHDGASIATVGDGRAWVWDTKSGRRLFELPCHDGPVDFVQFSPDGSRLVTASWDKTARVCDARRHRLLRTFKHQDRVRAAEFSRDGRFVVTASNDGTARVWDSESGKELKRLEHSGAWVTSACFSPGGKHILTAAWDCILRLWDVESGDEIPAARFKHTDVLLAIGFDRDGKCIVGAGHDRKAHIWQAQTWKPLAEPAIHGGVVTTVEFSPDGKRILTASRDSMARVYDVQSWSAQSARLPHKGAVQSAQFSQNGARIVTASADRTALIWDATTCKSLTTPLMHQAGVVAAEFDHDAMKVVTASLDHSATVWDARTGKRLGKPLKHKAEVASARFNLDGCRVVTASWDKRVCLWDAVSGDLLREFAHDDVVLHAQFSMVGKFVATASWDGFACILNAETLELVAKTPNHRNRVLSVQFSPDGTRFATVSSVHWARVWNTANGKPVTESPLAHNKPVLAAAFSLDGSKIVTASADCLAAVWSVDTGQRLTNPLQHGGDVRSAMFNQNGQQILTASDDGTVRLWDAQTGQPLAEPFRHEGRCQMARFSPDGRRILSASDDNTARLWDIAPSHYKAHLSCPDWLADLANAICGLELNDLDVLQPTMKDCARIINEIRKKLRQDSAAPDWRIWGDWLLADCATRSISPFSELNVEDL